MPGGQLGMSGPMHICMEYAFRKNLGGGYPPVRTPLVGNILKASVCCSIKMFLSMEDINIIVGRIKAIESVFAGLLLATITSTHVLHRHPIEWNL